MVCHVITKAFYVPTLEGTPRKFSVIGQAVTLSAQTGRNVVHSRVYERRENGL